MRRLLVRIQRQTLLFHYSSDFFFRVTADGYNWNLLFISTIPVAI